MNAPNYNNIAIIRLSSLGDIVHTIPALSLLRKHFPQSKISWLVEPAGAKLLKNISGIDDIIVINLKVKGFANRLKEIKRIRSMYRKKFDLIFDFQGLLKSAVLGWILKGETVGFNKGNLREPFARFFYKRCVNSFDENSHVIFKNLHLVQEIISSPNPPPVDYPLKDIAVSQNLETFYSKNSLEKNNYFVLNIGGGWDSKLLRKEQYIELLKRLKIKSNLPIVILWGNEKEKKVAFEITQETQCLMSEFLDFSELFVFIQNSKLLITADTLALHVADMVRTPSVGFFGPTSPRRNGSLLEDSVSIFEKTVCSFCYKKKCGKIDCIKKINLDEIIDAVERINEKRNRDLH